MKKNCPQCGVELLRDRIYCDYRCKLLHSIKKNENDCWEYRRSNDSRGYGKINFRTCKKQKWKNYFVHRLSYEIFIGKIPNNTLVLHKCDNPCCYNPEHLFLGTQKDNMHDCISKQRRTNVGPKGEKARTAKLTEQQVLEIRKLYSQNVSIRELQKMFGVNYQNIRFIVKRLTWKHI